VEATKPKADPEVVKQLAVGKHRTAKKWLWRVGILVVLGGGVGGYFMWKKQAAAAQQPSWITEKVTLGDLRETVTATGTLNPLDAVEVGAEVSGRVLEVSVDVNDRVKAGQVLVKIDPTSFEARTEESQAQLRSARASLKNAQTTVTEATLKAERTKNLHQRGLASDQDLEAAEAALERAKASVGSSNAQITVAQAGLKSAKTNLDKSKIFSPIDGIVLARSVEPGQTVTAGFQTPVLFTLARDLTRLELRVDVDEADVGRVKPGQKATFVVDAYPKKEFSSEVLRLGNLPKAGTSVVTYEALLSVNNDELLLRPGMTATATIITSEKKQVLSVPNVALRFKPPARSSSGGSSRGGGLPIPGMGRGFGGPRGGGGGPRPNASASPRPAGSAGAEGDSKDAVFVVDNGRLKRIRVKVGATNGIRTEVESPDLSAGMEVVVDVAETK
jgi:HlyD family secretion protein